MRRYYNFLVLKLTTTTNNKIKKKTNNYQSILIHQVIYIMLKPYNLQTISRIHSILHLKHGYNKAKSTIPFYFRLLYSPIRVNIQ